MAWECYTSAAERNRVTTRYDYVASVCAQAVLGVQPFPRTSGVRFRDLRARRRELQRQFAANVNAADGAVTVSPAALDTFRRMLHSDDATPRPNQINVAHTLLGGYHDVLVRRRTGDGKLWQSVYPIAFAQRLQIDVGFVVLLVPYRSLVASHMAQLAAAEVADGQLLVVHAATTASELGTYLAAATSTNAVIIATFDAFQNFNVCGALANGNGGVDSSSSSSSVFYVVIDEAHTLLVCLTGARARAHAVQYSPRHP